MSLSKFVKFRCIHNRVVCVKGNNIHDDDIQRMIGSSKTTRIVVHKRKRGGGVWILSFSQNIPIVAHRLERETIIAQSVLTHYK